MTSFQQCFLGSCLPLVNPKQNPCALRPVSAPAVCVGAWKGALARTPLWGVAQLRRSCPVGQGSGSARRLPGCWGGHAPPEGLRKELLQRSAPALSQILLLSRSQPFTSLAESRAWHPCHGHRDIFYPSF